MDADSGGFVTLQGHAGWSGGKNEGKGTRANQLAHESPERKPELRHLCLDIQGVGRQGALVVRPCPQKLWNADNGGALVLPQGSRGECSAACSQEKTLQEKYRCRNGGPEVSTIECIMEELDTGPCTF